MKTTSSFPDTPLDAVREYWNSRPCNIRHSPKPVGTREYFDEVEVFEAPLPSDLRFAGPEAYRTAAAGPRNFVRSADAPDSLRVPYAYCSLTHALAQPTPSCAAFDYGATAREIFADKYARWFGQYFVTNVVRASRPFNPRFAMKGAIDIVGFGSISVAHLAHLETSEPSFVDSDREHDLFDVASMTANFAHEVLAIPRVGRMCPWPGQGSYIPGEFLQQPGCDVPSAQLDVRSRPSQGALEDTALTRSGDLETAGTQPRERAAKRMRTARRR